MSMSRKRERETHSRYEDANGICLLFVREYSNIYAHFWLFSDSFILVAAKLIWNRLIGEMCRACRDDII